MRICMVGSGRMAGVHSRALQNVSGVQLHTVVDPDLEYAEMLRQRFGYERALSSLDDALADERLDAVVICTPNALHAAQSAAALRAGKHVLCEIPLALSLAEAEALVRLAAEKGLRLMVCHTERFETGRIELRRRIAAGELHPLHIIACFFMFRRGELKTGQARRGWVDNMLWHHGCHTVDAIIDLLGPHVPRDLHVQWGPPWAPLGLPLDVDLHWRAPRPFDGEEVLVSISLSHNARWAQHEYRVIGLEDDWVSSHGTLRRRDEIVVDGALGSRPVERQDAEFVAAVCEGRAPAVDGSTVLPTMRILQVAWDIWRLSSSAFRRLEDRQRRRGCG
ncbi:MAG: Gfo/Idh/MocA family oxidoreductase [Chloroflexi bacterium]|nr:Gfo/Idh/MocA family oxidoreductase [Chloroflexota bacterium]